MIGNILVNTFTSSICVTVQTVQGVASTVLGRVAALSKNLLRNISTVTIRTHKQKPQDINY